MLSLSCIQYRLHTTHVLHKYIKTQFIEILYFLIRFFCLQISANKKIVLGRFQSLNQDYFTVQKVNKLKVKLEKGLTFVTHLKKVGCT